MDHRDPAIGEVLPQSKDSCESPAQPRSMPSAASAPRHLCNRNHLSKSLLHRVQMKDVAAPHEQTLDVFNSKFYLFLPPSPHPAIYTESSKRLRSIDAALNRAPLDNPDRDEDCGSQRHCLRRCPAAIQRLLCITCSAPIDALRHLCNRNHLIKSLLHRVQMKDVVVFPFQGEIALS